MVSHDQKCHVAPHFDQLDLRNVMVPLVPHDASAISQWHHMTKKVMLDLISIVLTYGNNDAIDMAIGML